MPLQKRALESKDAGGVKEEVDNKERKLDAKISRLTDEAETIADERIVKEESEEVDGTQKTGSKDGDAPSLDKTDCVPAHYFHKATDILRAYARSKSLPETTDLLEFYNELDDDAPDDRSKICKQKQLNGRQARAIHFLSEFDFDIQYRPGDDEQKGRVGEFDQGLEDDTWREVVLSTEKPKDGTARYINVDVFDMEPARGSVYVDEVREWKYVVEVGGEGNQLCWLFGERL
ncbi:hypothetical protein HDV00_000435 [Rhizophlyctis rosea]|nr:hypothetical protein HDV00_000435 [Rhizophlyctis rosea]